MGKTILTMFISTVLIGMYGRYEYIRGKKDTIKNIKIMDIEETDETVEILVMWKINNKKTYVRTIHVLKEELTYMKEHVGKDIKTFKALEKVVDVNKFM